MVQAPKVFVLGSYVNATCLQVPGLPTPGESLLATACLSEPGGKGLNLALGAHRLGAQVDAVIPVGQDEGEQILAQVLSAEGLSTKALLRLPVSSGRGVGLFEAGGENMIAVWRGANAHVNADHIRERTATISQAQVVCAQCEIDEGPIEAAFDIARSHGVMTLLNLAPFRPLSARLLATTDVLVLNASEAARFFDVAPQRLSCLSDVRDLLATASVTPVVASIVVTMGAQGAVARDAAARVHVQSAFPIVAQDSTGSGDAFCAGLATALAAGLSWPDSLRRAAACGAWVAQRHGVLDALPTAANIDAFLSDARVSGG